MLPVLILCFLLVTVFPPAARTATECSGKGAQRVEVKGWPVLVGVRLPPRDNIGLQIELSSRPAAAVHTNLTLSHVKQADGVAVMKASVVSEMTTGELTAVLLLAHDSWATLKLGRHAGKLVLAVESHSDLSHNYTTTAAADIINHRGVHTVAYSCLENCIFDVDLKCRYEKRNESKELFPRGDPYSNQVVIWPFYVMLILLLIVCCLLFTWKHQRSSVRHRLRRQAQREAARRPTSCTSHEGDPRQEQGDGEGGAAGWAQRGQRVQYSAVLVGYDGPCTGDDND